MAEIAVETTQGETKRVVLKGLRAFNRSKAGPSNHKSLTVSVREGGAVVGGLVGYTAWGWFFVSLLWIDEAHRGGGIGSKLIVAAEDEARRRGCKHMHLGTFSFQAPEFYAKLGFREFARLKGHPPGFDDIFLTKAL